MINNPAESSSSSLSSVIPPHDPVEEIEPLIVVSDEQVGTGNDKAKNTVPFKQLFRFADWKDQVMISVGMITAAASGTVMPIFSIIFGNVMDAFFAIDAEDQIFKYSMEFVGAAVISFLLSFIYTVLFACAAERQGKRIREESLRAILRQDLSWFDKEKADTIPNRLTSDSMIVQEGIGVKFGLSIQSLSMFVAGFTIGFTKGWKLALVMLSIVPILAIAAISLLVKVEKSTKESQEVASGASALAEQTISSIKTVVAFGSEEQEIKKYSEKLAFMKHIGLKSGIFIATCLGIIFFLLFSTYGIGLWYGAQLVIDGVNRQCWINDCDVSAGKVLTVFWAVLTGAMGIAKLGPNLTSIAEARGAAGKLWEIMDRDPKIDPRVDHSSISVNEKEGAEIEFDRVSFAYPTRPDVKVLDSFCLKVKPGQTVALVGSSGCGKSTIAALVERFYDPSEGRVMINGTSLRDCSISSLRAHIGYVNQEPTLFSGTIKENIAYGIGKSTGNVSFEKIMSAAKQANAHDFIMSLPDKYETYVGEKGDQLSGGQKQRIAIARSIFKDPAILLLDEATSALDNQSEAQVQAALDDLLKSKSRTTIVIAHRLSTIRNADVILVLEKGRIIEQGSHDYLINNHKGGKYWSLVNMAKASKSSRKKSLDVDSSNSSGAPTEHAYVDMDVTQLLDEGDDQTEFTSPLIPKELKSQDVINTSTKFSAWKLAKLHQPDYGYFSLGLITSAICGSVFPLISLLLSDMLTVFYDHDANNIAQESKKIAITLFGVAIALGISTTVRLLCFTTMAEKLAYRLRLKLFSSILSKDMSWFDFPEHSSGILSTLLSNDINQIKSASGQNLGQHVQNFFTLTTALIIALLYGKIKLTAWLLLVFPVVAGAFYAQTKVASKAAKVSQDFYGKAGQIANQAILSVKSVQALGLEETMIMKYSDRLQETTKQGIIKGFANGLGLGFSDLVSIGAYGALFWYGGHLVLQHQITFKELIRSLLAMMQSAQTLGENAGYVSDSSSAKNAAEKVFTIIENDISELKNEESSNFRFSKADSLDIKLKEISFSYPSRPGAVILNELELSIPSGKTVAFVGHSGSGKSSIMSLLLRFYEPQNGFIYVQDIDIRKINVSYLRENISLVSQEPVLFSGTIAENISYGKPGASILDIENAAKLANAEEFILKLPEKYNTIIGNGSGSGSLLSGGQKQRIAIARALIRNPKILILDEATSALDNESEKIVQQSLDRLLGQKQISDMSGGSSKVFVRPTCLIIAHRLSTVKNADIIVVLDCGRVAEIGNHDQLSSNPNSIYASLLQSQLQDH